MKTILIGLVVVLLAGVGYIALYPEILKSFNGSGTSPVVDTTTKEPVIGWKFVSAPEKENIPYTNVSVVINGTAYEVGDFQGSCNELGTTGGIDGKGLLAGELSAAQCWYAGGGNEIGVFADEDGGINIMVGDLSEGEEGAGLFRGNFNIKSIIKL